MLKVELFIIILGLSFVACGPKSRKYVTGLPSATTDNVKVLNTIDPKDVKDLDTSTGPGCETPSAKGHKTIDSRLTVGTQIVKEKTYIIGAAKSDYVDSYTVSENTGTSISYTDVTAYKGKTATSELVCKVDSTLTSSLSCNTAGRDRGDLLGATTIDDLPLKGDCQVTKQNVHPELYENILYGLKKNTKPTISATRVTTVYEGDLTCVVERTSSEPGKVNEVKKALGKGTVTEVKVYTNEIPSMKRPSCGISLVLHSWEIRDDKNNVRMSQSHQVVSFKNK